MQPSTVNQQLQRRLQAAEAAREAAEAALASKSADLDRVTKVCSNPITSYFRCYRSLC